MKLWRNAGFLFLLLILAGGGWLWWNKGAPRRTSLQTLQRLDQTISTSDASALIQMVSLPAAIRGRTAAEQAEFLQKALRDEISVAGLAALRRDGTFGPLTNLFPAQAVTWTTAAGGKPEDCVALRMERNGIQAEVVLVKKSTPESPNPTFRIVRCNNVKQMAAAKL